MLLVIFHFPYQLTMHSRIMKYLNEELLKIRENVQSSVIEKDRAA
jgi:hypothetical protein